MKDLDDAMLSEEDLEDDDPLRSWEARDGDHLQMSFQCDCCHFQNDKQRNPVEANPRSVVHDLHPVSNSG
jgi:hypothetical protein